NSSWRLRCERTCARPPLLACFVKPCRVRMGAIAPELSWPLPCPGLRLGWSLAQVLAPRPTPSCADCHRLRSGDRAIGTPSDLGPNSPDLGLGPPSIPCTLLGPPSASITSIVKSCSTFKRDPCAVS